MSESDEDVLKNAEIITKYFNDKKRKASTALEFSNKVARDFPKNGVYVMFEEGETWNSLKRITRVGTHTKPDMLVRRLFNHFYGLQPQSVFRRRIAEAWRTASEDDITEYMNNHVSFAVIDEADFQKYGINRDRMESLLIATIYAASLKEDGPKPSQDWLGNNSKDKVKQSGMWLEQKLRQPVVTKDEMKFFKETK